MQSTSNYQQRKKKKLTLWSARNHNIIREGRVNNDVIIRAVSHTPMLFQVADEVGNKVGTVFCHQHAAS